MASVGIADALPSAHHKILKHLRGAQAQRHDRATHAAGTVKATKGDRLASVVPLPPDRPGAGAGVGDAQEPLDPDVAAVKQAIGLLHQRKFDDAKRLAASIEDPTARTLVEWALLRQSENVAGFDRYATFIRANPDWPSIPLFRRRAEGRLWQERRSALTIRGFMNGEPRGSAGHLALARALLSEGDRADAEREVRAVWRSAGLSAELETAVLAVFAEELTAADHKARMDRRIGAKDFGAAMRMAKHLGDGPVAIVNACKAAEANAGNGAKLLDAVPEAARADLGYALCRLHLLVRNNDVEAATKLVLAASPEDLAFQDADEWWRERRLLARKLLDRGDPASAYEVVRGATLPANPYYAADVHFTAGWIALRFLDDPATARQHFAHVDDGATDPLVRARAAYWRGRTAEALGQADEMRLQYETAAAYPTAYYGQLARAKLALGDIPFRSPDAGPMRASGADLLRAADMLYAVGARELALSFMTDLADQSSDAGLIAALGQLTADHNDAQSMLQIGKTALARGLPMDQYAFPNIGVPTTTSGPELDRSIVYAIVRTESGFDPNDRSPAKAVGLMQVTPEAGRDTAKRFGIAYSWDRLVSDPAYNTLMGSAEIAALLKEYGGSYVLTFAGYNAGRGRVKEWIAAHGDPRDPKVDAVDWVERIPFSETRNYVERVMENLQVYGVHFGSNLATTEPNLHRAASIDPYVRHAETQARAEPAFFE